VKLSNNILQLQAVLFFMVDFAAVRRGFRESPRVPVFSGSWLFLPS
jgi:hypothetical protein